MKEIVLGTAGHIDHGKTSLIKALTGVDTDRLKEEKRRGITIELGFASLLLPSGRRLGIVDVPGHEKFVKNMVAGATGIDIVVMVIAADEGVMPQTREHMEICSLLDIRHGFVALTKTDMVDEEWLELVQEDVAGFVQGTFLEDAPVVPVSALTGQGLPDFVATLDRLSAAIPDRSSSGLFRLPVDRVFSMRGFGTVVTGTLASGSVRVGDTVTIYPAGITSKVRGLQVHNQSVEEAEAGLRTAVNFQGLEKESINRGDVVASQGALKSSYMLDVFFQYLKSNPKPLKNRTRVRFHTGTSEVLGNLILLDREELLPGESLTAQVRLENPLAVVKDDRFVIRSYSPVRTIGGGRIINPLPAKHKRFREGVVEGLQNLAGEEAGEIITYHVLDAGLTGVSLGELKIKTNLPEKRLEASLQELLSRKEIVQFDKEKQLYVHGRTIENLTGRLTAFLGKYHTLFPLKGGMSKEELKSKFPPVLGTKLFTLLLNRMAKNGEIVQEGDLVRLSGHKVSLGVDQEGLKRKILATYQASGLTPPYFKELCLSLAVEPADARGVLDLLIAEGSMAKIKEELFFHTEHLQALKERLVKFLMENGQISTQDFKEMTGASRKYVIPLLEYFDSRNVTIRVGDTRQLRRG